MRFSEQLFALRRAKGLSQEELAEQVGVSRQAFSKWENGEAAPDLQKLLTLSEALEVSLDHLCGKESSYGENSAATKESHERRYSPWRTVGLLVLGVLAVLGLIQMFQIIAAPEVKALPTEVEISGVYFSSADGETLHYSLIPSVSSGDYTYCLLLAPEASGEGTPSIWELELTEGRVSGEIPVSLNAFPYWTVALQISNGQEILSVPVATNLCYDDRTVSWVHGE